ncbi:MAG: endonuclease MutS2 [Oscillospiraceae bacterium]|nr:endonuclease MutS2 [Oscillospiraceae bacterium]
MNKYYQALELNKILEMLSAEASNEATRQMALSLSPVSDIEKVKNEIEKTSVAFELSVKYGTPAFGDFKDVRESLKRADAGALLSLRELLDISDMLYQIRMLAEWHRACKESDRENALEYLFNELSPNKYLEEKIKTAILSDTEISDSASPALADIRRRIARAGLKIRESLEKLIKNPDVQKSLQENIITMRDGRYVVPVKAEQKGNVPGLVHAASGSGATFFIEPVSVVEANNEIRILQGEEQAEIERVIAELSAECADYAEFISEGFLLSAELNLYFAKSNLGAKMRATVPVVSDDGKIALRKARHPLIDSEKVVPVDIKIGYDYQALIVTGPNTGGKTVLLKTTGLLTAMTMCGMLIPAGDGSKISVFEKVLVDIGDSQSIEQSLSTFSSHIVNISQILEQADDKTLVLTDELGSGTDPVEGAALAVAIIEELRDRGSRLLVTTHYQELKMYAINSAGVENASCEFDAKTLQPTYRLIIGSPGKSNAFYISSKLGIPAKLIHRANELVSTENRRFEEIITKLEDAHHQLSAQNEEISKLKSEHSRKLADLQTEIDNFNQKKGFELEKARLQAMRIVESCRMQSDELLDELSELRRQKDKEDFSRSALTAKSRVRSGLDKMYIEANPVTKREEKEYVLPRPLKKGDSVLIFDINKTGTLTSEPDSHGNVFVATGAMKTKVNISKLRLIEEEKVPRRSKGVSAKGVSGKLERELSMELDIRGYAVDEGIHATDGFIDNAVLSGAGTITIVHGKGTGILRKGIQAHLKSHPSVKGFRSGVYGEGEDGVTIAEIK